MFCQSKTSLLSAESTFDHFNRKHLGFWFSVTRQCACNSLAEGFRLILPRGRLRFSHSYVMYGECAWMASIMLFRIMVWDVDPIIYLHQTMEKDKVLLPPPPTRNNRKEIATSTQLSLQVQRASVARMTSTVNGSDFVILSFFFFFFFVGFSQKLHGWVTRNIEKKAHGLSRYTQVFLWALASVPPPAPSSGKHFFTDFTFATFTQASSHA